MMVRDKVCDKLIREDHKLTGRALMSSPREMYITMDWTDLRGAGPNLFYSFLYQLPKWGLKIIKIDEALEVTPEFADYYGLTIDQKAKLEASIKQGLTSAAQAVADFELLAHDARRYREILDYFIHAKKSKDEHVLRSLFVDRVDAFTGEKYSMISMAQRWPTIITDFIRMKGDMDDIDKIRRDLDVSQAEATVLKTKNALFQEWKKLFLPTLKERYARIENMRKARKKSVDEYKNWLKPYISKYRMLKEETEEKPAKFLNNAFVTPGFGQAQATSGIRLWVFREAVPPEKMKSERMGGGEGGFVVHPYDDFVRKWIPEIEKKYGVTINDEDVKKVLETAVKDTKMINPKFMYYSFNDVHIQLNLTKTPPPKGGELDNIIFYLRGYVISINLVLLLCIEAYAREKAFEKYVNELIGAKESEEEEFRKVEEEFKEPEKERLSGVRATLKKPGSFWKKVKPGFETFFYLFVKPGPYEHVLTERVTKIYHRSAYEYYSKMVDYLRGKMQIP